EGQYSTGPAETDTFPLGNHRVYGGFFGIENARFERGIFSANPAILEGDLGGGQFSRRIVTKNVLGEAVLDGFFIQNGRSPGGQDGPAIHVSLGLLHLQNCMIQSNRSSRHGGAAYYTGGVLPGQVIRDCIFFQNQATNRAGAIDFDSQSRLELYGCIFDGNRAGSDMGGALRAQGPVTIENCIFSGNRCFTDGGAARIQGNHGKDPAFRSMIRDSLFVDNRAEDANPNGGGDQGGALWFENGSARIENCGFTNNFAGLEGGAIRFGPGVDGGSSISNSTFTGNVAEWEDGGAIFVDLNENSATGFAVIGCVFESNTARLMGGAFHGLEAQIGYRFIDSVFDNNRSYEQEGGAIKLEGNNNFRGALIDGCTFSGNRSDNGGGAVQTTVRT
ncbi:MAG: hypothetical protein AAF492_08685, partial [Verrucomicrobiota bacterium]